ncbi:MAG: hypothetical protein R3E68_06560 [Burkholderiaceae bacterium]
MTEMSDQSKAIEITTIMDLQEQILMAATDLERATELIASASGDLWQRLGAVMEHPDILGNARLQGDLQAVMTALQFEDMTRQIITHNQIRMHCLADALGAVLDADIAPAVAVSIKPSAVAQRAMDAGSTELF